MQLLAGRNNENTLQNLILQVSVISLMVLLWRVDSSKLAKNPEKD
jgi:hypothetical protein